ncbi:MAG: hypothetical protein AUG75_13055 [Cyanobacteria bacterium 13_1_20CM_4_61_6]|nr:MAG: hypothetical protein AUG75_13055 [Cyanobacteria bacterium 13_1_20CM_4_61_6]
MNWTGILALVILRCLFVPTIPPGNGRRGRGWPSSHSRQARVVGNPLHNQVADDAEFLPTVVKFARA